MPENRIMSCQCDSRPAPWCWHEMRILPISAACFIDASRACAIPLGILYLVRSTHWRDRRRRFSLRRQSELGENVRIQIGDAYRRSPRSKPWLLGYGPKCHRLASPAESTSDGNRRWFTTTARWKATRDWSAALSTSPALRFRAFSMHMIPLLMWAATSEIKASTARAVIASWK